MTNARQKPSAKADKTITTGKAAGTKRERPTRLDQFQKMIAREEGASIAEMSKATGWQAHSVRGALAGGLKKRGLSISSKKIDGVRRYYASANDQ